MKNSKALFALLLVLLAGLEACSTKEDTLGRMLFAEFGNPALKNIDTGQVTALVEKTLKQEQAHLKYEDLITAFYKTHDYMPVLLKTHVSGGGIGALAEYLKAAGEHGLPPALFGANELVLLLDSLKNRDLIGSAEEAAPLVAALEIRVAASLANYGNALQFGFTDPAEVLPRYYIASERPDSASLAALFGPGNLKARLDSIQPDSAVYLALKKALSENTAGPAGGPASAAGDAAPGKDKTHRALVVNLERLRWRNKPAENKYVLVNIAAYRLDVINQGKPELSMKVCVGEPARRWQTPQLASVIERVQVNPIWNIPESIASGEIIQKAANDPFYLENANINVYRRGELISDSRKIDWSKVPAENTGYTFKQRPGRQNALGKIKFLFDNQSSVYLHDTPAKAAFNADMRAISHGCVRVEKPLELAYALFGRGNKFEIIKTEMGKENPTARDIELDKGVPVYLTYATCRAAEDGTISYRPDVYGLDSILFSHLQVKDTAPPAGY